MSSEIPHRMMCFEQVMLRVDTSEILHKVIQMDFIEHSFSRFLRMFMMCSGIATGCFVNLFVAQI